MPGVLFRIETWGWQDGKYFLCLKMTGRHRKTLQCDGSFPHSIGDKIEAKSAIFRHMSAVFGDGHDRRSSLETAVEPGECHDRATRQEERQQIFEGFSGILLLARNRLPQGWQLVGIYGNVRSEEDPGSTYLARVAEDAETRDKDDSYASYTLGWKLKDWT